MKNTLQSSILNNIFETVLHNTESLGILIFSESKEILYVNSFFQEYSNSDIFSNFINPTFDKIIESVNANKPFEGYITLGTEQKSFSYKGTVSVQNDLYVLHIEKQKNISDIHTLAKYSKLINENTNLHRALISEKKEVEKHLHNIEHLLDELNKFIGVTAHDIRSPVATVASYSKLLLRKEYIQSNDEASLFLKIIEERCNFSLHLLNDLLDYSKIESGTVTLSKFAYPIIPFIEQIINNHQLLYSEKSVSFKLEYCNNIDTIVFDSIRIEQVFNNLLSNAAKFSPPNSDVLVKLDDYNDHILIEVHDEGPGVSFEEQETIFKPYNTSTNTPTANEKSTGLGLSISKKIIELHGGNIKVQNSKILNGACFSFTIPISESPGEVENNHNLPDHRL